MTTFIGTTPKLRRFYSAVIILTTALGWYLGNGLTGDYWYLVWLAPIPVLIGSFYYSERISFTMAFTACLLGRLSWFVYLDTVTSLLPTMLLVFGLAYVFARIATYSGAKMRAYNVWYSVLIYPVLMTTFEYLVLTFSPDGTASSLAYTQANVLPIVQFASAAGTPGITFLVSLFPSCCALGWLAYTQRNIRIAYPALGTSLLVYGFALYYGYHRLDTLPSRHELKAGLIVMDETKHHPSQQRSQRQISVVLANYSQAITRLTKTGVATVLLPETAFRVIPSNDSLVISTFKHIAKRTSTCLIVGLADYTRPDARNTVLVFDADGNVLTTYAKQHLVGGFERQFTPGQQAGFFPVNSARAGVAICKDLDFPATIRDYGRGKVAVLFVPANDFRIDDWLHARMAVLRGVENGFSVVRTARQGRLTVSDPFGRVLNEAKSNIGNEAQLIGSVPLVRQATLFTYAGNWFGLLNLTIAFSLLVFFRLRTPALRVNN